MNTKDKGERSEGQILAAFLRAGKVVLHPFGDSQRYDMVLDEGGRFVRVQCKTGRILGDVIAFNTCSGSYKGVRKPYLGDADLFAVYCPQNNKVYAIPVEKAPCTQMSLRLATPKNGQQTGIRMASDFEVGADLGRAAVPIQ